MELSEAKNPYDIFFKVYEIDEASIPEHVMLDMMDLWEDFHWQWNSDIKCCSYDVSDVAAYASRGSTVRVFESVEKIDTSKPIVSIWANVLKRWHDNPESYSIEDYDALNKKLKSKINLSYIAHWGKENKTWVYTTHPIGYAPFNSEWFLVSYE